MKSFDVAIVGFGPVGALLANLLGVRGVRTAVIEREREVYRLPRAVHFDHEVMRIFQSVGLTEAALENTAPILGYEFLNAQKELLFCFDLKHGVTSQGWKADYMFHQPSLEAVLREAAAKCESVEVFLDREVESFCQEDSSVEVAMRDRHSGESDHLHARYLVGCDGANSLVRNQAGLELDDLDFDEPWLVVDAKTELASEDRGLPTSCTQLCDPARPITFIPVVGPYIRWEFMLRPEEDKQAMLDPARIDALIAEWIDPNEVEVIRAAVYDFHALVAKRWNTRRVFIAGDAAHQMPPFLGQGMCAGMRDVANLGWKLALVTQGVVGPQILDSYQREREPHVRKVIEVAVNLGRVIGTTDPEAARLRDAEWLARPQRRLNVPELPGIADGIAMRTAPLAGAPGLQARVCGTGNRAQLLDDFTGPGFTLLRRADVALPRAARAVLARLDAHEVAIDGAVDIDGAYATWFDQHGCDAVLVRPDHQVFGGAVGRDAATRLLEALSKQID